MSYFEIVEVTVSFQWFANYVTHLTQQQQAVDKQLKQCLQFIILLDQIVTVYY